MQSSSSRRHCSKISRGRGASSVKSTRRRADQHSSKGSGPRESSTIPSPISPFEKVTPPSKNGQSSRGTIITPRKLMADEQQPSATAKGNRPNRKVYLIRHGQSVGQTASRHQRQTDSALTDCGLTQLGQEQARAIPTQFHNPDDCYENIDWVICSPLTRALETAVLGFPDHPILCHYDLREVGSAIPENTPRSTKQVLAHLQNQHCIRIARVGDNQEEEEEQDESTHPTTSHTNATATTSPRQQQQRTIIDLQSLRPDAWPRHFDTPPKVVRRDRVRHVFAWLAETLPDHVGDIAVVCHYHVIRAALAGAPGQDQAFANFVHGQVHPANAAVYRCELASDGTLQWLDADNIQKQTMSSGKKGKRFIGKTY